MKTGFDRRKLLQMMMGSPLLTSCLKAQKVQMSGKAQDAVSGPKKFLFVFTAMGGASINDCFLARRASEVKDAATLNVFPDLLVKSVDGTDLRAVDMAADAIGALPFPVKAVQSRFLNKYKDDIMVATCTGTAVAHPVAQQRSVTGYDAWNGRTLQEAVAAQYGRGMLLPNINMATVGYAEHGRDRTLPGFAVAEPVPDPAFFPFSLHGYKGLQGVPDDALIAMARQLRDQKLEPQSAFHQTFGASPLVQDWMKYRARQSVFEKSDAINKLNPFADSKDLPFKNFGLDPNRDGEILREVFPDIGPDPLQTQALLAYLSVTQGLTCTATFGIGRAHV